jgi:uncharacterized glyoxalase superfamily protein PhnB
MPMLKSLNTILLYCSDQKASARFYQSLGFAVDLNDQIMLPVTLGGFTIQLLDQSRAYFQQDARRREKGTGVFIEIEVEDIDGYYRSLVDKGLHPASEPRDWPWGNREFAIKDPDGYRIVFYKKST